MTPLPYMRERGFIFIFLEKRFCMQKILNTRISQRHDTKERWDANSSSIPIAGEIIVYDPDATTSFARIKIGDGVTSVGELPFIEENINLYTSQVIHDDKTVYDIIDTYILTIDYDESLAFDTSEIVTGATSTTSVLGQAILGQMVLA
jgi:hypothetical protein